MAEKKKKANTKKKAAADKKASPQKKPKKATSSIKASSAAKKERHPDAAEKGVAFPVIGIGASAGGLEALEKFLIHMASDSGMAFVIIQHLSPKYKSIMGSILSKHTSMKILKISDGMKIESNCVYLNPPDMNVAIFRGTLQLMAPTKTNAVNLPIDFFFRSLSEDLGEKAICIILSGSATDGTLGMKAVKGEGGLAIAQEPASAKYDGMPRSAIKTGLVDFIIPVERIPGVLLRYVNHPYIEGPEKIKILGGHLKNYSQKIFALIRTETGHDFSNYKQNSVRRRIGRRMAVNQIKKISDYVLYLQKAPAESQALFKDLLIGVTSFFRDPEAFEVLKEQVLLDLLKDKQPDSPIRIWVVGCSTGEEAYSLAILFSEVMDRLKKYFAVQIFASDIDAEAIDYARQAVYPDSIAADVSRERLKRFFTKEDKTYAVKKNVREMIVFAVQSIIKDPPFSKIDLVTCRNLMIYMDATLQKKMLPLFHYTLNKDGILFLGPSESVGEFTDLYSPIDSKWKIFKRKGGGMERAVNYPGIPFYREPIGKDREEKEWVPGVINVQSVAERIILNDYAPSAVLINEDYEILHFLGETDNYLSTPTGKASLNILKMAREDMRTKLTTALHTAVKQKKAVISRGLKIKHDNVIRTADVIVRPIMDNKYQQRLMLVIFDEKIPSKPPPTEKKKPREGHDEADQAVIILERELEATKEHLQSTIEEMETSNEELKATNEEMQSVNEELQSTNEEMETSKEELQSTNEELVTVNSELKNKIDELSQANNDMNNLFASTGIGTIFLDASLCIKRFTPQATKIFNLIQSDVGRPIGDITSKIKYGKLRKDAKEVLNSLIVKEEEILGEDGSLYAMRISPYRTTDNVIDGVIATFMDISKIRQAHKLRRLATVVMDSNDAVTVQDFDGKILAWNRGAEIMYGWSEAEALKMNVREIIPEDKRKQSLAYIEKIAKGEALNSFKTQRKTKDGRILNVFMTTTKLVDSKGRPVEIATTERELSELEK
jgi:two-component system CheB/CheR fusion protein